METKEESRDTGRKCNHLPKINTFCFINSNLYRNYKTLPISSEFIALKINKIIISISISSEISLDNIADI